MQSLLKKERENQRRVVGDVVGEKDRRVVLGERGERMTGEDLLADEGGVGADGGSCGADRAADVDG